MSDERRGAARLGIAALNIAWPGLGLLADEAGLELVPVGNVVGRPLFFTWWPGQRLAGCRIAD